VKIGIPRALLYYYYGVFWEEFFKELGHEVIVSPHSNKEIVDTGIKSAVPEICVPIKIFLGHLKYLIYEKNVDYAFVPRMISIHKGEIFCPKFMGLPDLVRNGSPEISDKILTTYIESKTENISNYKNYISLSDKLNANEEDIKRASRKANIKWLEFRRNTLRGIPAKKAAEMVEKNIVYKKNNSNNIKIAVVGYVYNVYDSFLSMDILDKLHDLNVDYMTFEMLDNKTIFSQISHLKKRLFWTFSNKLLGAGYYSLKNHNIDGLIHLTAFGCGPDSFLGKLFEIESDIRQKPFMTIRIDEHTGENHLQTRIEAFVDMLKRKKEKESA